MEKKTEKTLRITFMPDGITACVPEGTAASDAADSASVMIGRHCGGAGVCGKCRVMVKDKSKDPFAPVTETEKKRLAQDELRAGVRLACCARIARDGAVYVIDRNESRGSRILEGFFSGIKDWSQDKSGFGAAVDIGTTTVVCYLLDLDRHKITDRVSFLNPQVAFGDDVISRIAYSSSSGEALLRARKAITAEIEKNILAMTEKNGIPPEEIKEIVIAGNTVMEHLFAGVSPESIGRSPYCPQFLIMPPFPAADIGMEINETCTVKMLPNVAGYVGADIVAGVAATGMDIEDKMRLLVDIGTNNEIVIGSRKGMYCCATAAGPAFEGARIQYGMRAAEGAIEKVFMEDGELACKTIGGSSPRGLCGSGLIDAIALLLDEGVISLGGRFEYPEKCTDQRFAKRLCRDAKGMVRLLLTDEEHPVYLTQKDIREVQLAAGAVKVGTEVMLERAGITAKDIDEVCLAGAFGNNINIESAVRVGLIPNVRRDIITGVKNSSGLGACMSLASDDFFRRTKSAAEKMAYVELSSLADFQKRFINAMSF
ncbi:MAG: DUF4445 domain-containing protein [Synergistes sp.]|nr:DUF4445 domain-containing protein [Synergistes sp.]